MSDFSEPVTTVSNSSSVNFRSASVEKVALFRSLFRGREDVYPRRFVGKKSDSAGYAPVCGNEWVRGILGVYGNTSHLQRSKLRSSKGVMLPHSAGYILQLYRANRENSHSHALRYCLQVLPRPLVGQKP